MPPSPGGEAGRPPTVTSVAFRNSMPLPPLGMGTPFNVTPMAAGAYFNKLECFCFTDLTLKPGESKEMPVVFFVDPEIVNQQETKDLKVITLSYTFYPSDKPKPVAVNEADGKSQNL